jgi:hypothetical protein
VTQPIRPASAPISPLCGDVAVKCSTVALDDEPTCDEEVDTPYSRDPHLHLERDADTPEHQPHQRLDARLRTAIDECPESLPPVRQGREHLSDHLLVEETEMQRTVERGDRVARRLAAHSLHDRAGEIGAEAGRIG